MKRHPSNHLLSSPNRNRCRTRLRYLGLPILGILMLPFTARPVSAQVPVAQQAPAAQALSQQGPLLIVKAGSLTVQAQNVSLRGLVENVAREARIAVQWAGEVEDQKISVEYKDFPLEAALQQILKEFDAFYFFGVNDKPPATLQVIWVYPKTKGRAFEPVPPEQWASTKELKERFASEDPETRADAIAALVERLGEGAQAEVLDAIRDPDPAVRNSALYESMDLGMTLPQETLAIMAGSDENSFARFLALGGLSGNRDMQGVVEHALNDPDQYVQAKAREILQRWKWADEAQRPPQSPQTQQQIEQEQAGR